MANPTPHRVTTEEFDADPAGVSALAKTAPVYIVDADGKTRMCISYGSYLDENDCTWCGETKDECTMSELCAGAEVRRLRAALEDIADPSSFDAPMAAARARAALNRSNDGGSDG